MMHIILTSYNRPALLRRALQSLIDQTCKDWVCYLQDDGSGGEVAAVIRSFRDPRIIVREHATTETERQTSTRYSVLINEIMPTLREGVVGYLCDNVEYHPKLVEKVSEWFANTKHFAGYVYHMRDVYSANGLMRRGMASDFGHWDLLPPIPDEGPVHAPAGMLDHSQVFHRLPCGVLWNESPAVKACGDGDFFTRLAEAHGPILSISNIVLTLEHLLEGRV